MAEFDPRTAAESFFKQRERSNQEIDTEAAQAAAVAEMLGYYTPELQQKVTQPLGQNPTVGENLLSSPIRGLGHLFGNEGMQQYGAPQEFDLGQAQPQYQPQMPQFPSGTDPETKQMLERMGLEMGFSPAGKEQVIPDVPSETMGRPRLKTNREYKQEAEQRENVWKLITDNYQTEQQRRQVEAEIESKLAAAEYNRQIVKESQDRVERGPDPTEMRMIKEYVDSRNEEGIATGGPNYKPLTSYEILREWQELKNSKSTGKPAAKIQMYNMAVEQGYVGKIWEFEKLLKRLNYDPYKVASEIFYGRYSDLPFRPEYRSDPRARAQKIAEMAIEITQAMDIVHEQERAYGGDGLYKEPPPEPIPERLVKEGVDEYALSKFQEQFGKSRSESIRMLLNADKDVKEQENR